MREPTGTGDMGHRVEAHHVRVHEIVAHHHHCAGVVDAAQKFGQEDDISVISITRTEVLTPALA